MITLTINAQEHELDVFDSMPLLWAIRFGRLLESSAGQ
jgi:isoquinoline 1-oxidoreductase alpha subunit